MRGRFRAFAFGVALVVPVLAPALVNAGTVCASASGRAHAALVVDTGARATTYCVALDADSVSGIHLIQLAGAQYGLAYRLGFGGQAVCELNGVGAAGSDCFGDYPDFWGYWHGTGSGGWSWAGSGAGSALISDGEMDGWVWGQGDSGATHDAPPSLALEDVCGVAPPSRSPDPTPPPPPTGGGGGTGGEGSHGPEAPTEGGGSSPSPTGDAGSRTQTPHEHRASRPATPTPTQRSSSMSAAASSSEIVRAAAAAGSDPSPGPPFGAFAAIGAVAFLGIGGAFLMRRRRSGDASP